MALNPPRNPCTAERWLALIGMRLSAARQGDGTRGGRYRVAASQEKGVSQSQVEIESLKKG